MSEDGGLTPAQWADELPDEMLHCRELGHSWSSYTASYDKKSRCYTRILICTTCDTERRQVLDSRGEVVKNSYTYVEGYLAKGVVNDEGNARVPRAVFRITALQRSFNPRKEKK